MTSLLGIDEAGRGPVLGPMVMAGIEIPQSAFKDLERQGVADSKLYGSSTKAQQRRKELAVWLSSRFRHRIEVADAAEVDLWVLGEGLNALERSLARRILGALPARPACLDGHNLFKELEEPGITALDKADATHLEVAAASILAKDLRDRLLDQLVEPYKKAFGEVRGGGYANLKTLAFVQWHQKTEGNLPPFYRRSYRWKALTA
ncbi:MAG: hypothetical protein RRB13_14150 [bacterium]|nr:hypothetical protein [bacterium]